MKTYLILVAIIIALAASGLYLVDQNRELKRANQRHIQNIKTLASDVTIARNELGLSIAEVSVLQFNLEDAQRTNIINERQLHDLKIKLKNVKTLTNTMVRTEIRDVPVTVIDSIEKKCFHYTDEHLHIDGCINDSTGNVNATLTDTLSTIVHIERKRILWVIRYGIKDIKATTTNQNPYVSITDSNVISIID